MQTMRSSILAILLFNTITFSLSAQEPSFEAGNAYSTAYADSSHATHWSVYVPVAALVAAAIWLGIQDGNHSNNSSVGGNGSLADSSSRSTSSSRYGSYNGSRCIGNHCHSGR